MSSKMENFFSIIYLTKYMQTLWSENFDEYLKCIELTQDWEKFDKIEDFIDLKNKHIKEAIKEIFKDKKMIEYVKDEIQENLQLAIDKLEL